jgi:malate dehydrogenase (oxaloacetate-decarboxylating)
MRSGEARPSDGSTNDRAVPSSSRAISRPACFVETEGVDAPGNERMDQPANNVLTERTPMSSLEAWQDRLERPIVFLMQIEAEESLRRSEILAAVEETGAVVTDMELAELEEQAGVFYELTVFTTGDEQILKARGAVEALDGTKVLEVIDVAMESHRGGACETVARSEIESNTDLRIVYTPGVARVCKAIQAEPQLAWEYTNIPNKVAIVTNGTAILGLGDIGPVPGMPVMEGKSAIFWEFARISAEPILVNTKDPDEFIRAVELIAPSFGAIQVEDVAAPECFRITRELDERLNMPVMHDDQYGTATIVLAGLFSALKKTGKKIENLPTAICGAGAAGTAIADLLLQAGVPDVILCDSVGIIHRGREQRMNDEKRNLAEWTNQENRTGTLADAMRGAELFVGCSQPNIVTQDMVRSMADKPILFPLANPVSEISRPDARAAGAAVYADGRMMNNALAYPGIFRGALDTAAERISLEMLMAAAKALADVVPEGQLMPEMMSPDTHAAVADAVARAGQDAASQTPLIPDRT